MMPTLRRALRLALVPAIVLTVVGSPVWLDAQRPDPPNLTHRPPVDPAVARLGGYTDWAGVYVRSSKVGVASIGLTKIRYGERDAYRYRMKFEVKAAALGEAFEMSMDEQQTFAAEPPYALLALDSNVDMGPQKQRVTLRRGGDGFVGDIEQAGETRQVKLDTVDYALRDLVAPEVWFASKPKKGAHLRVHSFDSSSLTVATVTFRVDAHQRTVLEGVPSSIYTLKMRTKVGLMTAIARMRMTEGGKVLTMVIGGGLEMRLEPEAVAKRLDVSVDLFALGLAKIDKPLGDPAVVTALSVRLPESVRRVVKSGPWQRVSERDGGAVLEIGSAYGTRTPATPEDIREALRPTVDHPCRVKAVVDLARRAIGDAATPRAKVARLVPFVADYIADSYSDSQLTVLDIINAKKGDCSEHALLFATLAKAVGVPCRQVGGWIYMGDDTRGFGLHAWNEVVLDGAWYPVDPTWNEMTINATHVRLTDSLDVFGVIGTGVKLELLRVARRPAAPEAAPDDGLAADGAELRKLATGFRFTEGPASDRHGHVYFTDIPNNRIHRWSVDGALTTVRERSGGANGLYFDRSGALLCCEGRARRLTSFGADGSIDVLAERFGEKRLNSPNDLWIDKQGGIYFTDPRYGKREGLEQGGFHVYYLSADRQRVTRVIDDLEMPNGVIGSPDGTRLYVADTKAKRTYVWPIVGAGTLGERALFAKQGSDGMTVDERGNVYLTRGAVTIYSPAGERLKTIEMPEGPSNVTFGGRDRKTLFITARTSLYALRMAVAGGHAPLE